jgi:mannosyltransferase OCH1-like enzyme
MKIPKIIHQMWSGIDEPLPDFFRELGETWKEHHPDWKYEFWDNERMNSFVKDNYEDLWDIYNSFQYNIQRWDVIRYLVLYKMGGVYVDFDSECLKSHDTLFKGKSCCFSMEPEVHGKVFNKDLYFNNALMACLPNHPFMKEIIDKAFQYTHPQRELSSGERIMEILMTTGPLLIVDLYERYLPKDEIFLISAEHTSPLTDKEIKLITRGYESEDLELKLKEAYSIHYFFNGWVK